MPRLVSRHSAAERAQEKGCVVGPPAEAGPDAPAVVDVATAMIQHIGDFADETVIVVASSGADLAGRLAGLGAASVVVLGVHERPEQQRASLALVPHLPSLDWAAVMLGRLRRAMLANGRVVCCAGSSCSVRHAVSVGHMLKAHGFSAVRAAHVAGHLLLSAEVPLFGPRCHA